VGQHVQHDGGTTGVLSSLTCTQCGLNWDADATPGQAGPDYAEAYAHAPDLLDEELALLLQSEENPTHRPQTLTGHAWTDYGERRLLLLRQAACQDRITRALELGWFCGQNTHPYVAKGQLAATLAAKTLREFDLAHDHLYASGPLPADSPEWETAQGFRAYTRQEYAGWHRPLHEDADLHGTAELFDAEGRPL
jgi:hypothetical protein